MDTTTYLSTLIDRTGTYQVKNILVEIRVKDARNHYGRLDVLIEPVCGTGATWVAVESVALREDLRGAEMPKRSRTPARYLTQLAHYARAVADWADPPEAVEADPLEPEPEVLAWLRRFDDANQTLGYYLPAPGRTWSPRAGETAHRYDDSDNLEWFHLDGSRCDVFWSDRPRPSVGRFGDVAGRWWCTEHQQYLTTPLQQPEGLDLEPLDLGGLDLEYAAPELLEHLRAAGAEVRVTPDLDAYAAGLINASQIRCVLCGVAPCACEQCATCNFTKQARYNGCPRGCDVQ